jgi:hypothetical protein
MRRLVPGCVLAALCALPTPPEGAPPLSGNDEVVLEPNA